MYKKHQYRDRIERNEDQRGNQMRRLLPAPVIDKHNAGHKENGGNCKSGAYPAGIPEFFVKIDDIQEERRGGQHTPHQKAVWIIIAEPRKRIIRFRRISDKTEYNIINERHSQHNHGHRFVGRFKSPDLSVIAHNTPPRTVFRFIIRFLYYVRFSVWHSPWCRYK